MVDGADPGFYNWRIREGSVTLAMEKNLPEGREIWALGCVTGNIQDYEKGKMSTFRGRN